MSRSFKLLRLLESYNGIGGPDAFLRKYKRAMELEDDNEIALCKCFKVTLAGPASSLYNSLPPSSINSFGELCNKFTTHFIRSRRSSKRAVQMFDVTQRPTESIQEFVERFNREPVNASDLTDDIRIMNFVKALLPSSRLAYELSRKNPTSVKEMYSRTHGCTGTTVPKEDRIYSDTGTMTRWHKGRTKT